jgi:hypothetical protein
VSGSAGLVEGGGADDAVIAYELEWQAKCKLKWKMNDEFLKSRWTCVRPVLRVPAPPRQLGALRGAAQSTSPGPRGRRGSAARRPCYWGLRGAGVGPSFPAVLCRLTPPIKGTGRPRARLQRRSVTHRPRASKRQQPSASKQTLRRLWRPAQPGASQGPGGGS